jgi:hypothetical protein
MTGLESPIVPAWADVEIEPADTRDCPHGEGGASVAVVSGAARPTGAAETGGGVTDPASPAAVWAGERPAGIRGESFQGIPPFCFIDALVGGGVFSIAENAAA